MAYELIKVSELPELTTPSDPNVIPIQDGDYLKRISFENLKEAATGDVADDLATEVTARESAVSGEATARGNADTAILADLAPAYSTSATYAVGDYCTKDGVLKRCNTAITTAEAWNSAHWDDAKLGGDVSTLRSALSSNTINLFDPSWLLSAQGWQSNGEEYYGTAQAMYNEYKAANKPFPFSGFKSNTQYTFSVKTKVSGAISTNSCFRLIIKYTDNSSDTFIVVKNEYTTYTYLTGTSAANKTISAANVSYGDGLANTLYFKEFQCEEGAVATKYIPYITATDYVARRMIENESVKIYEDVFGPSNGHEYIGEKISLNGNTYNLENLNVRVGQGQDCVVYDKYALAFSANNAVCLVTDITTNTQITTFQMPLVNGNIPHCNTAVWGDTAENEDIPLLYVNVETPLDDHPALCAVYQISRNGNTWSATLVQTIDVSFVGDAEWGTLSRYDAVGFCIEGGLFYAFGASQAKHKTNVIAFNIPSHSENVTLTRQDIIASFEVPYMEVAQGCTAYNGKLYIVEGLGTTNNGKAHLYVVDLVCEKLASYIDLTNYLTGEPEFAFVYDGNLIIGAWDMIKLIV